MNVMGIDPSLTGTGVVVLSDGSLAHDELIATKPGDWPCYEPRLKHIAMRCAQIIKEHPPVPKVVCIEAPAFSKNNSHTVEINGLYVLIRTIIYDYHPQVKIISPTSSQLKKWTAGHGRALKEKMMMKVLKHWGYEPGNNDMADAYALAQFAIHQPEKGEIYNGNPV